MVRRVCLHEFEKAVPDFVKALELQPDHANAKKYMKVAQDKILERDKEKHEGKPSMRAVATL